MSHFFFPQKPVVLKASRFVYLSYLRHQRGEVPPPGVVAQGWGPFPRSQGVEATRPWCPGAETPPLVGYRFRVVFGSKVFSEVRDTGDLKEVVFFLFANILNKEDIRLNKTGGLGWWFGVGGKALFFWLKLDFFWLKLENF